MTVYNGTSSNDTFTITGASDLQAGDVFNGNGGFDTIFLNSYTILDTDFSQITLNGISAITVSSSDVFDPITLTVAELNSLSEVVGVMELADGGTISLAGKTVGPVIQLANADTTLDLTGAIASASPYDNNPLSRYYPFQVAFDIICGTGNYTITGSSIYATAIDGGLGNDVIHAGSVNTIISGGGGLDKLYGGAGADFFLLNAATPELPGTVIDGGGGNNTLSCSGTVDLTQLSISNIQTIEGSIYATGGPSVDLSKLPAGTNLSGQINIVGTGTADFSGVVLAPDISLSFGSGITAVDFSDAQILGTGDVAIFGFNLANTVSTFTGGSFAYSLSDSETGPITVNSGAGRGSVDLSAGGGTVNGGSGNLTVIVNGGLVNVAGASGDLYVIFNANAADGSTFAAGTGGSANGIYVNTAGVDLSNVKITNFATLTSTANAILNASLVSDFSTFSGTFAITGSAALSFSGKTLKDFSITLAATGGTVDFTGATITDQNTPSSPGVDVYGVAGGPNFITGSAGDDTILTAGLGDAIHAAAGNDIVEIISSSGLVTGTYDGGGGSNTLVLIRESAFDLSQAAITNFQSFDGPGTIYSVSVVKLTIAELAEFTTAISNGEMMLVDGGTISLAGVTGENASFQLSNFATTIDLRAFVQSSVTVTGGAGNDTIYGLAANTAHFTSGDVNVLYGGGGNDTLVGSSGSDYLDGGTGINTAVYTGDQPNYRISEAADYSFSLADTRSGSPDVYDQLVSIQHLQFADGTIDLTGPFSWAGDGNRFQLYSGQTLNLSNATGTGDAVNGDNGTINLVDVDLVATGNHQTITTGSDNAVISSSGASDAISIGGANATVTIGGNGTQTASADIVSFGQPGTVTVTADSRVTVTGAGITTSIGSGDVVTVTGTGAAQAGTSGSIAFTGSGSSLILDADDLNASGVFLPAIAGFAAGDILTFSGLAYQPGDRVVQGAAAGGMTNFMVETFAGAVLATFALTTTTTTPMSRFTATPDGAGGIDVRSRPSGPGYAGTVDTDDFAGTGFSDVLFRAASGGYATWQLSGTGSITGGGNIGNPGSSYGYAGTGDFNRDGISDVLFRSAGGTIADWLIDGTQIIGGGVLGNPGAAYSLVGTGDFNGDGTSDVLFYNRQTGAYATWDIAANAIGGGGTLGAPGPQWVAKGTGDFNGDGKTDILFQNADGGYAIWELADTSIIASGPIGNPGAGWFFKGTGDFNGDGKTDILFENTAGTYATWDMDGTSIVGGGSIGDPGSDWSLAGTGDYNGDGTSDLLFRNIDGSYATWDIGDTSIIGGTTLGNPGSSFRAEPAATSQSFADFVFQNTATSAVATWEVGNGSVVGGGNIGTPGTAWTALATGDFAGTGETDILFRNTNGTYATWATNGESLVGGSTLGSPGTGWSFKGTGDFNGDGKTDVLFENTSGQYASWDLSGGQIIGGGNIGVAAGYNYVATADIDGDGRSDVIFKDAAGNYAAWLLDDTAIVGGGVIGNPGAGWSFAGVGDFNGDGRQDLLFENAGGTYASWDLNGTHIAGGGTIGNPGAAWHLAGIADLDHNGTSDIIFENTSGTYAAWLINDTTITSGATLGNVGTAFKLV